MTATSNLLLGAASLFSWLVSLFVLLAFVIAILTVVRSQRPDVVPVLLGATLFEIMITLCSFAMRVALPRLVGMTSYAEAQGLNTVVFAVAHAAARALLLWGILRLARPASAFGSSA
jgi:hypothetical protein